MKSNIAEILKLQLPPVALLWAEEKPLNAKQFGAGRSGCVMFLFANVLKGASAALDRDTFGCPGGGVGLGFGNIYENFPGGLECFYYFLSSGNEAWETGRQLGAQLAGVLPKEFHHHFSHGEAYKKSPELVKDFVEALPIMDIPAKYVVMKPLSEVDPARETPENVTLMAAPDQLAALVVLANYGRRGLNNVTIPFGAGCQSMGIMAYAEAKAEYPRAVVGLIDISARKFLKSQVGHDYFSFTMPWRLYLEMEANVAESFLNRDTWRGLVKE